MTCFHSFLQDVSLCHSRDSPVSELAREEESSADSQEALVLTGRGQFCPWASWRTPRGCQQTQSTRKISSILNVVPQSCALVQPDLGPSLFKGSASGSSAVRVGRVDGSGPQLRTPSCAAGGSVCDLLLGQPLGRPRRSGEFGHGDPPHHSPPVCRYEPQHCSLASGCSITRSR